MTTATMHIILWAVAFVFFVVLEIANGAGLFSIWFALAALLSMLCAIIFEASFLVQFIVFVVGSIVLVVATRPLSKKVNRKAIPTNFELDVGKTAMVIEAIDNDTGKGRVKLDGTDWAARSVDGAPIAEGVVVKVVEVSGSKLIVSGT